MKNTTKTTTRTSNAAKTAKGKGWETLTDAELAKAVELMVSPDDLTIRGAAIALLEAFDLTPEDAREQLKSGEYFNAGACFYDLSSTFPRIVWNNGALRPDEINNLK